MLPHAARLCAAFAAVLFLAVGGCQSKGADSKSSGSSILVQHEIGDQARRAAEYVARILEGAKPGELPVETSSRYELIVNLKAAAALGLAIPEPVLLRADSVIR